MPTEGPSDYERFREDARRIWRRVQVAAAVLIFLGLCFLLYKSYP